MLVSVIIPACEAEGTIARCIASLLAQTFPSWEGIIVSDDRRDYAAVLARGGIGDPRLRFLSTGAVRSGAHNARNIGFRAAAGELIAQLDADDLYDSRRLELLAPLAAAHGAVTDQVMIVSDADDTLLYSGPQCCGALPLLSAEAVLDFNAGLLPVVHRDFAAPPLAGVEYADDVVANLRLVERLGALPLFPRALYHYRVRRGSLCHDANSGARYEDAYSAYIARLRGGDAFGLVRTGAAALAGFTRKREANRLFADAERRRPGLTFQAFMAPYCGSVSRLLLAASDAVNQAGLLPRLN
jgi:succinoglycan biosynthesis protein ExoO